MDSLIVRAAQYAEIAFRGKMRKDGKEPAINHSARVAGRVGALIGSTEEMMAGGYLHDVVEDTPVTQVQIIREFDSVTARYVQDLTDQFTPGPGKKNRKIRKRQEADRLGRCSIETKQIKLIDIEDNLHTTPVDSHGDRDFAILFVEEKLYLLG